MSKQKTETLYVRLSPALKAKFFERAEQLELTPSDVVRALVASFADGRATIIPPDNR